MGVNRLHRTPWRLLYFVFRTRRHVFLPHGLPRPSTDLDVRWLHRTPRWLLGSSLRTRLSLFWAGRRHPRSLVARWCVSPYRGYLAPRFSLPDLPSTMPSPTLNKLRRNALFLVGILRVALKTSRVPIGREKNGRNLYATLRSHSSASIARPSCPMVFFRRPTSSQTPFFLGHPAV